jgi:hypothetical protein
MKSAVPIMLRTTPTSPVRVGGIHGTEADMSLAAAGCLNIQATQGKPATASRPAAVACCLASMAGHAAGVRPDGRRILAPPTGEAPILPQGTFRHNDLVCSRTGEPAQRRHFTPREVGHASPHTGSGESCQFSPHRSCANGPGAGRFSRQLHASTPRLPYSFRGTRLLFPAGCAWMPLPLPVPDLRICAESRHGPIAAAQICSVKPIPTLFPRTSRRAEMARWTEEPVDPRRRKARLLSGI